MPGDVAIEIVRLIPPEWLPAMGIMIVLVYGSIKIVPAVVRAIDQRDARHERETQARIKIESQREERKSKEEQSRQQRDRERSENEGRWLSQYEHATTVQEQTNVVIEGVREQMRILNLSLNESKERSQDTAKKVDEIHRKVI